MHAAKIKFGISSNTSQDNFLTIQANVAANNYDSDTTTHQLKYGKRESELSYSTHPGRKKDPQLFETMSDPEVVSIKIAKHLRSDDARNQQTASKESREDEHEQLKAQLAKFQQMRIKKNGWQKPFHCL